jgi:hypothetical protein
MNVFIPNMFEASNNQRLYIRMKSVVSRPLRIFRTVKYELRCVSLGQEGHVMHGELCGQNHLKTRTTTKPPENAY